MGRKFNFTTVSFTRDQVREMTNDELYKHIFDLKRKIKEAKHMGNEALEVEVEYCYLDHERQMRQRQENVAKRFKMEKRGR